MTKPSNSVITLCGALILTGALLLAPLPLAHGQASAPGAAREAENAAKPSQLKDPCKHQDKKLKEKKQCPPEQTSGGVAKGDFNGDGFGDLAVGVPDEDLGTIKDAGAVNVIYGSADGLTATGNQFWTQDSPNIVNTAEVEDRFGSSLASGDFDGDGFSDLAVGVPFEDINGVIDTGAVSVIYGSPSGLAATGNQFWSQGGTGVLDDPEFDDRFGSALVWGDFNNDGFGDLAIGVFLEDVGAIKDAGAVNVIYGTAAGLTPANNQFWTQDSVLGGAFSDSGDGFGAPLAAGDFNNDGSDDLAVGVHFEAVGILGGTGEVDILYGSAAVGLTSTGSQAWTQDSAGIADTVELGDFFGSSLAVGDFGRDGVADLAIGVLREDVGSIEDAGAVHVIYGSPGAGLTSTNSQFLTQDTSGILDSAEVNDNFGAALAAGDFNGDGQKDLAIGVRFEDVGTIHNAGAVNVLYGGLRFTTATSVVFGLVVANNQFWTQDNRAVLDVAEENDRFGSALTAWNFGKGPQADLAVGVPFESFGIIGAAGAVNVLYGSEDRLTGTDNQFWTQDSEGIFDQAESSDFFGSALY